MGDSGKVALGRFVMRAKEHLVSIRPRGELLTLTTMRFHDEVRADADVAAEIDAEAVPGSEQIENAIAIIAELEVPFEPAAYRDEHRAHLQRLIKRKQKGQKISVPPAAEKPKPKAAPTAPDLMGALEQSLARIRGESSGAGKKKAKKTPANPPAPRPSRSGAKRSSSPGRIDLGTGLLPRDAGRGVLQVPPCHLTPAWAARLRRSASAWRRDQA